MFYPPINSLYIGWKTWSDSTVNYIIHSIKITSDNSSSIVNPTLNAAANRKQFHSMILLQLNHKKLYSDSNNIWGINGWYIEKFIH